MLKAGWITLVLLLSIGGCAHTSQTTSISEPKIIAHRGGVADAPENTLYAVAQALENGADEVWITVQLSQDGVPVLYRPKDLSANTNLQGAVSAFTAAQLRGADAAWQFGKAQGYPLRRHGIYVPTLAETLQRFPNTRFYLDMKSPDADARRFAEALEKTVQAQQALNRVRVYSTEAAFTQALSPDFPRFASRSLTRDVLADSLLKPDGCSPKVPQTTLWHGFELSRKVKLVETFTLGEGISESEMSWRPQTIRCFNSVAPQQIILFGINSEQALQQARQLGVYGVMVDSPRTLQRIRSGLPEQP